MANEKYRWRVDCWEYERGFGRRPMGTCFFDSEEEADKYCRDYASGDPDCFFRAEWSKVLVDC